MDIAVRFAAHDIMIKKKLMIAKDGADDCSKKG